MDFTLSKTQENWQQKAKCFAEIEIAPYLEELENELDLRLILFQKMAKQGFFTFSIPSDEDGDTLSYLLAIKEIAKVDAGIGVAMSVTTMVAEAIWRYGTPEQQQKYLTTIGDGACVPASFALTEKDAGSDIKHITTTATYDSAKESYILNGEKQFITNADSAGVILVIARDHTLANSSNAISAFLVDRNSRGMSIVKKERKLGLLTANLVTVHFDHCSIPKTQLLGELGMGLKIALSSLDSGRLSVSAQALGIGEAAFEAALFFSKSRKQFDRPICEQQVIAFKLADMRVKLDAGCLLLMKAAWLRSQGMPFTAEASIAKLFCSEASNDIAYEAMQIHGGYGYIKDYAAEKYFRDARVTTIYEGTSEIQRLIIARNVLSE